MRRDPSERSELHEAAVEGDVERTRRLLDGGADVNARAWYDTTPLMDACGSDTAKVRQFAQWARKSVVTAPEQLFKLQDRPRLNPKQMLERMNEKREFDDAVPADDTATVRLLLDRGADANAAGSMTGNTPLASAAMQSRERRPQNDDLTLQTCL